DLRIALDWRDRIEPNEAWARRYHPGFAAAMTFLAGSQKNQDDEVAEHEREQREKLARAEHEMRQARALAEAQQRRAEAEEQKALEQERRLAEQMRAASRLRLLLAALGAMVLLALLAAGAAFFAYRMANAEKVRADREKDSALTQKGEAERQRGMARENESKAIENEGLAKENEARAEAARANAESERRKAEAEKQRAETANAESNRQKNMADTARNEAVQQTRMANALRLTSQAQLVKDADGDGMMRRLLLLLESLTLQWTAEGYALAARELGRMPIPAPFPGALPMRPGAGVEGVGYSPDGRWIARVSARGLIIRDMLSGQEREHKLPADAVRNVPYFLRMSFSEDNNWFALALWGGTHIWDTASWREVKVFPNDNFVRDVAFSPDSRWVAVVNRGLPGARPLRLYKAGSWEEIPLPDQKNAEARAVSFSPDSRLLAVATSGPPVFLDMETRQMVMDLPLKNSVSSLAFDPKGDRLAAMETEGIKLLEVSRSPEGKIVLGNNERLIKQEGGNADFIAFDPAGRYLAAAKRGKVAKIWLVADPGQAPMTFGVATEALAFSPDGRYVVTGTPDGALNRWDLQPAMAVHLRHGGKVNQVAYSADGRWLATAGADRKVRIFEAAGNVERTTLEHGAEVARLAFIADGRRLLTVSGDTVRLFAVDRNWAEETRVSHQGQAVTREAISPDGKMFSTWTRVVEKDNPRKWVENQTVWEMTTGRQMSVGSQSYERIGSGRRAQTRLLSNTATGIALAAAEWKKLAEAHGENSRKSAVWTAEMSGDRITLTDSKESREFNVNAGQTVHDVAFSPDGRWLAIASDRNEVMLWPLQAREFARMACARLTRNLSPVERKEYMGNETAPDTCPGLPAPK
ncbi:MAG: hypothetical protein ACKV2V_12370, partial [Blastocatellia bacterium]